MSLKMMSIARGPQSNREPDYQKQHTLVKDEHGRLRYAALSRRVLALPPEILAEIFIHCLPEDDFVSPDPTSAPLLICGVCRLWRETAISTPGLWSSLFLDFEILPKDGTVEFFHAWLSRARGTPLSLSLQDAIDKQVPAGPIGSLLTRIAGLSKQWRNIDFDLGQDFMRYIFPVDGVLPLLEKSSFPFLSSELPISFDATQTPKLREVSVFEYHLQIQLPWLHLTTFSAYDIDIPSCIDILRQASNLLSGTFDLKGDLPPPSSSNLEHIHLQSLVLGAADSYPETTNPMSLLNFLKTPALKSLALRFVNYHQFPTSPLLSFLRAPPPLHTLELDSPRIGVDSLIECLKAAPSLLHLKVRLPYNFYFNPTPVFVQLTQHLDFLPKLQSFHIWLLSRYSIVDANPVIQMLCWRWAGHVGIARLQSFCFVNEWEPTFGKEITSHPEFGRLKEEGMVLSVGKRQDMDSSF